MWQNTDLDGRPRREYVVEKKKCIISWWDLNREEKKQRIRENRELGERWNGSRGRTNQK